MIFYISKNFSQKRLRDKLAWKTVRLCASEASLFCAISKFYNFFLCMNLWRLFMIAWTLYSSTRNSFTCVVQSLSQSIFLDAFVPRSADTHAYTHEWRNLIRFSSRLLRGGTNDETRAPPRGKKDTRTFEDRDVIGVVTRSSARDEMTSNEMAKMARLFSTSDMLTATWLRLLRVCVCDSARTAADVTRRVRLVASNTLYLPKKCQSYFARAM